MRTGREEWRPDFRRKERVWWRRERVVEEFRRWRQVFSDEDFERDLEGNDIGNCLLRTSLSVFFMLLYQAYGMDCYAKFV